MDPPSLVTLNFAHLSTDNSLRLHPIWQVTNQLATYGSYDVIKHRPIYRVSFDMTRNCTYWLMTIILPCIILAILQPATFWISSHRGTSIRPIASSFITLIFVGIQYFAKLHLPKTTLRSTLVIYLLSQFTIGCFSTLLAVMLLQRPHTNRQQPQSRGLNPFVINQLGFFFVVFLTLASHYYLYSAAY